MFICGLREAIFGDYPLVRQPSYQVPKDFSHILLAKGIFATQTPLLLHSDIKQYSQSFSAYIVGKRHILPLKLSHYCIRQTDICNLDFACYKLTFNKSDYTSIHMLCQKKWKFYCRGLLFIWWKTFVIWLVSLHSNLLVGVVVESRAYNITNVY